MRPPSAPRPALTRVHALIVTLSTTLLILGHALPASAADPTTKAPAPAYAPGPAIEPVHPGQPLPFLPPLPGMQVGAATVDDQAIEFVPLPDRVLTLGPPLVRVDYVYAGPAQRSARQVLATYRQALQQAGWTLQSLPRAPDVLVALYAQQGRCLRLKLHSVPGTLHVTIWEPAAHADPARLRQALAQHGRVPIYGIVFEINKRQFRPNEVLPTLHQILRLLQDAPDLKLEIAVHSADKPAHAYATRLSHERARHIHDWLIAQGIAAARLVARGYEDSKPIASNATDAGRARNRRVELIQVP